MPNVVTPSATLSYPNLFTAKAILGGPVKFSAAFVFDQAAQKTPAFQAMKDAVKTAITAKFGAAKAEDKNFVRGLRSPFRDAGEKQQQGYEEGFVYITCSSNERPKVVDRDSNEIIDPSLVWAGQIVRASLGCFAYDTAGNKGVSFGLNHVQILNPDRPRLDGRLSAEKAFGGVPIDDGALVSADDDVI